MRRLDLETRPVTPRHKARAAHFDAQHKGFFGLNKLVMVVDKDVAFQDSLRPRMRERGHAQMTILDGDGALALMKAVLPDLIIMESKLPDISGNHLLKSIRSMPQTRHTHVIVYSDLEDEAQRRWMLASDPNTHFVSKTEPLDVLLAKAEAVLNTEAIA